jgi:hypothetical protein
MRRLWIVVIGTTTALVLYAGAGGVRGTDQYWYLADAETLARDHTVWSNNVFPVGLLSPGATLPPAFKHNILSVYLAGGFATVLGGLGGWLALNLVATFGTAALIWLTARSVAPPLAAAASGLAYPLLPITFWQTTQPVAEVSTALFAALVIYAVAVAGTSFRRWLFVVIAVGLLYLCRESYLALLVIAPIGFLLVRLTEHPGGWRPAVGPTATLAVATGAVAFATHRLMFENYNVTKSYTRLLHTAVPGQSDNMFFNFDLSPENLENRLPFDGGLLLLKLKGNLAAQFTEFINPAEATFYWTFNLLVITALATLWRMRRGPRPRRVCLAALAVVGVHVLTIALFQNQFRYLVPAIPGLLVVFAVAVGTGAPWLRPLARRWTITMVLLVLVTLPINGALAQIVHEQGVEEGRIRTEAERLIGQWLQPAERLLVVHARGYQLFAYAARPRLVLFFDRRYTSDEARRLLAAFDARYLLAPEGSPAAATLSATRIDSAAPIIAFGRAWRLYRVSEKREDLAHVPVSGRGQGRSQRPALRGL